MDKQRVYARMAVGEDAGAAARACQQARFGTTPRVHSGTTTKRASRQACGRTTYRLAIGNADSNTEISGLQPLHAPAPIGLASPWDQVFLQLL
jgi:hypothetical protein